MVLLPVVIPECSPGLVLGCFLSNLYTGNAFDIVFGTLATLLAVVGTIRMPKKIWLQALPPVILNGVVVGLILTYAYGINVLWYNIATVAVGEALAVYVLGIPLVKSLEKAKVRKWIGFNDGQAD